MTNSNAVITVELNAKNYGTDVTTLTVSCGEVSQTIELTETAETYTVYLEGVTDAADQHVTISSTGSRQRWYLYSVNIYRGGMVKAVSETGDENTRVITGITDKYYVVENLTPGATYKYYVEANYTDGTNAQSNTEQVTLLENQDHGYELGDVNHDGLINVTDVTLLINYVVNEGGDACPICADLNGDGNINVTDVTLLISKAIN